MRILVVGGCGFVGSRIVCRFREEWPNATLVAFDNLSRAGAALNVAKLKARDVSVVHGDVRLASDLEGLADMDWIVDGAANPSVIAGVGGSGTSRQLLENNLFGTVNMLELARQRSAGFILLSTSRVYSVNALAAIPLRQVEARYMLDEKALAGCPGLTVDGVGERFDTVPPLSLYGVSKKASEDLALEYAGSFGLPVWIDRCGVMAGAGQFGRPDQGIVAFWIHSWREKSPLRYLGFGGHGWQVRDVLDPGDLAALLIRQIKDPTRAGAPRLANVGGGMESAFSLAELTEWCARRFGPHTVVQDGASRSFDIPWLVLDDAVARKAWDWRPERSREEIFESVARFAEAHDGWLAATGR